MQGAKHSEQRKSLCVTTTKNVWHLQKNAAPFETINLGDEGLKAGVERILGDAREVDCFMDCVGFNGSAMTAIIETARRGATVVSIGIIAKEHEVPNLPDVTEHELNYLGSSMFWPEDFHDVIESISEGKIITDKIITHHYKMADIQEMYDMVDAHKESYMKIMLDAEF